MVESGPPICSSHAAPLKRRRRDEDEESAVCVSLVTIHLETFFKNVNVKEAERAIQLVTSQKRSRCCSIVTHFVRNAVGAFDVFELGDHVLDTQDGIDNHHYDLVASVTVAFFNMQHHASYDEIEK